MFGLFEIRDAIASLSRAIIEREIYFYGMPIEYASLMEKRVNENVLNELKKML